MKIEKRFNTIAHNEGIVEGYAVKWNKPALIPQLGTKEQFERGSLKAPRPVTLLSQHDNSIVLGSTKSKTLELEEDDIGLKFKCQLPASAVATREALSRGDLSGASIGFHCHKDDRSSGVRKITKADLSEISLVTDPAHDSPIVYRSAGYKKTKRKWTDLL